VRSVHSPGSGQGPAVASCECNDEPSGSGTTELIHHLNIHHIKKCFKYDFHNILTSKSDINLYMR
jgi:hypothetical protein